MNCQMASILVLVLLMYVFNLVSINVNAKNITLGSSLSLSFSENTSTLWPSASGIFAFGFYPQGNGFAVGIWLISQPNNTIVWTANRDDPPITPNATLELTSKGQLLLHYEPTGREIFIVPSTTGPARSASMLDTGNFVLYDNQSRVIWETFAIPTDTLLGGQILSSDNNLTSSNSTLDHSSGRFCLVMQSDGNLVSYPLSLISNDNSYWSSWTYGKGGSVLHLNRSGFLLIQSGQVPIKSLFNGSSLGEDETIIYRATLDYDGILRLYAHNMRNTSSKVVMWSNLESQCDAKGFCGINSYCSGVGKEVDCYCYPGFVFIYPNSKFLGCYQNFSDNSCTNKEDPMLRNNISHPLKGISWFNNPYSVLPLKEASCRNSCLEDCNCWAVLYYDARCHKYKLPIRYGKMNENSSDVAFFKMYTGGLDGNSPVPSSPTQLESKNTTLILVLASTLGFVACLCFVFAISSFFVYKHRAHRYKKLFENANLGFAEDFTLQSFSYNELEIATSGFGEELGRGTFGAVYKGALSGGKSIAVKRLERVVEEGIREFRAEITTIGRTHHRNLVQLLGFCIEGQRKLLVYEFMSNGSLADLLFKSKMRPSWKERVRIVLEVARGVFYLHEECGVHIIHCNLKPQNILLDDCWTAKISDFGMARLSLPNQVKTSSPTEEGTMGYFAPEWHKNALISVKADIYSFGVVLLEIICCRRNIELNVSTPEEINLSTWVHLCFLEEDLNKLVTDENVDFTTMERLVKVGLWCIQDDPDLRPPMKNVILMLEGTMDIPVPPSPLPLLLS